MEKARTYYDRAAAGNAGAVARVRLAQIALASGRRDEGLSELEALSSEDRHDTGGRCADPGPACVLARRTRL